MTPGNRPQLALDPDAKTNPFMFRLDLLQNDRVRYANQPIAVVIAETLEAATEGAALLSPKYEEEPARTNLASGESFVPPAVGVGNPSDLAQGDVEAGWRTPAEADRGDLRNACPVSQRHGAARRRGLLGWRHADRRHAKPGPRHGERAARRVVRHPAREHPRSAVRFSVAASARKASSPGPQILGILAARLVGKPVKLVLRREHMYGPVGHRAPTRQTSAASRRGRRIADAPCITTRALPPARSTTSSSPPPTPRTRSMRPRRSRRRYDAVRLDTGTPLFMRAPGEATGSIALESAIDEMALACGMDPLAFRLKNYAETEPMSGKPFSSKALRDCYAQGAERFGWAGGRSQPGRCAMTPACWSAGAWVRRRSRHSCSRREARAVIRRDGKGVMQTGAHDMGQGAWTALAQIAADGLGARYRRRSSSTRAIRTCPMRASPAARPTPPRPVWRSTMQARLSSPSSRTWPRRTSARRCSARATPA